MESNTVKGTGQGLQFAIICVKQKKKQKEEWVNYCMCSGRIFYMQGSFFIFFEILNHVNVLPITNQIFTIIKIICSTVNIILIRQTYDARVYIIKVLLDIQNLGC